jgi:hypothetical protein
MQKNKQVGGDHYISEYQHWDFAIKVHMHYLSGCATKYLCRHKKKNGVEDLRKAKHYVEKLLEEKIKPTCCFLEEFVKKELAKFVFVNKITATDSLIIGEILNNNLDFAVFLIDQEIQKYLKTDGQEKPFGFDKETDVVQKPREDSVWK